jgi:hypothetical protein
MEVVSVDCRNSSSFILAMESGSPTSAGGVPYRPSIPVLGGVLTFN